MSKPLEFENRRDFLKKLGAASAATLGFSAPRSFAEAEIEQPEAKADCCILLWMGGGMAAPDTFGPKAPVGTREKSLFERMAPEAPNP